MHLFSIKLALLASLAVFGRAEDSCDNSDDAPFAPWAIAGLPYDSADIGGPAGEFTCLSRWSTGDSIIGIEAWATAHAVEAIKFKFAKGGESKLFGKEPQPEDVNQHVKKSWDAGEQVSIHLFNNKPGNKPTNAIGMIQVYKGDENILQVGCRSQETIFPEVSVDSGAGIILGVKVRADQWISSLEFKMLKSKVLTSEITNIELAESMEDWNAKQKGMENVDLSSVYFVNDNPEGGPNMTYKFANTVTKKNTKTVTHETRNTWGVGIEVKQSFEGGIPGLAEVKSEVTVKGNYERQQMTSDALAEEHDQALTWEMGTGATANMLPPGKAAHCKAWAITGEFDSEYTGTVQAKLEDGSKFNYYTTGKVSSVSYMDAQAVCDELDLKDVPTGVNEQPGVPINNKRAVAFRG